MIKFILAVIAMIFVSLAAYVYMNPKETHATVAKVAQKTEKSIVKKETPSVEPHVPSIKNELVVTKRSPKLIVVDTSGIKGDEAMPGEGPTMKSSESLEIETETEERILEIEDASGLTDSSEEDKTPMETEKMVFQ